MTAQDLQRQRVLVAYASKHGATAEIARRIGRTLEARGLDVDLRRAADVGALDRYDAIVLGSAVYALRWRRDARRLLGRIARTSEVPATWLFSSGWIGDRPADPRKLVSRRIRATATRMGARGHVVFGGRVPLDPTNLMERAMARNTPPEKQDSRDWPAIDAWAHEIAEALLGVPAGKAA